MKNYLISNADDLLGAVSAITECIGNEGIKTDMKLQKYASFTKELRFGVDEPGLSHGSIKNLKAKGYEIEEI